MNILKDVLLVGFQLREVVILRRDSWGRKRRVNEGSWRGLFTIGHVINSNDDA